MLVLEIGCLVGWMLAAGTRCKLGHTCGLRAAESWLHGIMTRNALPNKLSVFIHTIRRITVWISMSTKARKMRL